MATNRIARTPTSSGTAIEADIGLRPGTAGFSAGKLRDAIERTRGFEGAAEELREQHIRNVDNSASKEARFRNMAAQAAQLKLRNRQDGSFASQLAQTERRGRARQGILTRGDEAVKNQQLKDRLQMARSGINRRGALMSAASNAERIRGGLEAAQVRAGSMVDSAYAGAGGFLLGAGIKGFGSQISDFFNQPTTQSMSEGTAAADFMNFAPDTGFDFTASPIRYS